TGLNGARTNKAGTDLAPETLVFELEEALVSSAEETVESEDTFELPVAPPDASEDELTTMVKEYMPLVRHAVNRIVAGSSQSTILGYEDMVSCGVQGLLEAHRTYDDTRGAKFSTYALPRIRGSILDALRAAHPLPRSLQKVSSDIEKASASLYTDLGRSPTREELAQRMGLNIDEFLAASKASSIRVVSLESL